MLKVISMIEVNAPCRLLFQLIQEASSNNARLVIGMFLGAAETSPAIQECHRRGFELAVFSQRHLYDPRLIVDFLKIVKRPRMTVLESLGIKSRFSHGR